MDAATLQKLYHEYIYVISWYYKKMVQGDDTGLHDTIKEIFLSICKDYSLKEFVDDEHTVRWFVAAIKNRCKDQRWSSTISLNSHDTGSTVSFNTFEKDAFHYAEIQNAIDRMKDDRLQIIARRAFLEGNSIEEIAAELHLSQKKVENSLLKLKRDLRKSVLQQYVQR